MAYCRARSAVLPTALPWYTHTERRHMHWKAFIEEQRSFSNFCNRIRALAPIRQPGENAQLVIAYGAFGTSSGMGPLYKRSKQEEELDKLDNATGI
jgi:hypothetical protein